MSISLSDLQSLLGKPVRIVKSPFEDGYVEPGMYAYVVNVSDDRDCFKITFDLEPFKAHNRLREGNDWRGPNGTVGSATDMGWYPKGGKDTYYLDKDHTHVIADYVVEGMPPFLSVQEQVDALLDYARRNGWDDAAKRIEEALATRTY